MIIYYIINLDLVSETTHVKEFKKFIPLKSQNEITFSLAPRA